MKFIKNKELFDLNKELLAEVEQFSDGLPLEEWDESKSFLIFSFVKSYRTVNSVLLLCQSGNGQDAFMLVRTLFDLMVTTGYIFQKETKKRIKLYNEYDWILRDEMLKNVRKNKKAKELLVQKPQYKEIDLNEIKDKAKKHRATYTANDRNTWSKKSIWQMSKEVGFGQLYNTLFALGSQLSHSASRSVNEYMKEEDGKLELMTYPSDTYVNESLVGSFHTFFYIVTILDTQLDLGLSEALSKLEKRALKIIPKGE